MTDSGKDLKLLQIIIQKFDWHRKYGQLLWLTYYTCPEPNNEPAASDR